MRPISVIFSSRSWTPARSGSLAGAVSAFAFVIVHDLLISDIWFTLIPMLIAGAVCGLCIGWTYGLCFEEPSVRSWLRYNLLYVAMFALLGAVSVLVYEPITTVEAVIAANESPNELFGKAMPLILAFTLLMAIGVGVLYARSGWHYAAILSTCVMLVLMLGLNVAVIGLVEVPSGSMYLIAEMFGLIVALNVVFVLGFIALERRQFFRQELERANLVA